MKIDVHCHPDCGGHNLEKCLKNMDMYGIDKAWLLSCETPLDEYDPYFYSRTSEIGPTGPIPFSRCISYAERAPGRFILGYAPDPRRPEAIDKLKAAIDIYGVRTCGEIKLRMMYDNPDALRLYRFCGDKGLPVTVHIDYEFSTGINYPRPNWWYGGGIEAFERALKACPETNFLGHAPGFWAHISGDDRFDKEPYPKGKVIPGGKLVEMLRKYPNLYCDISAESACTALSRDTDFTKQFLTEFQDRVLFARDDFENIQQELLGGLELTDEILVKIYSGNAIKLVPLEQE